MSIELAAWWRDDLLAEWFPRGWGVMLATRDEGERNLMRLGFSVSGVLWNWQGTAPGSALYIAQCITPDGRGPVKIGTTRDVRQRVMGLAQGLPWPLRLVATVPDVGRAGEQDLHRALRVPELMLRGEWYTADVLRVLRALPAEGPVDPGLKWERP